jgi:hypothetical protein
MYQHGRQPLPLGKGSKLVCYYLFASSTAPVLHNLQPTLNGSSELVTTPQSKDEMKDGATFDVVILCSLVISKLLTSIDEPAGVRKKV